MYGVHEEYTPISDSNRLQMAKRYGVSADVWCELDVLFAEHLLDTYYVGRDTAEQNTFRPLLNNHLQPLQALYFDRNGQIVSYHVNCYADGFPNLRWNQKHAFDVFPPVTVAPPDTLVRLGSLLHHIKSPCGDSIKSHTETADYTVVVMWPVFMGRQSKRLIRIVKKNLQLADSLQVNVLFVNNDNFKLKLDDLIKEKTMNNQSPVAADL